MFRKISVHLTLYGHCGRPPVLLHGPCPQGYVLEGEPLLGRVYLEPELVHGLEARGDVSEDVVAPGHYVEVGVPVGVDVPLEGALVEPVHVLLDVGLENLIVTLGHLLAAVEKVSDVAGRPLEGLHSRVHLVIA